MTKPTDILREAEEMRWQLGPQFQDEIAGAVSREASALAARHVRTRCSSTPCIRGSKPKP